MMDKTFDFAAAEPRLYAEWLESGAFSPEAALARNPDADAFTMVIPPPNVTGSLHIGHALNNTLQDVLARFHRMRGRAVLWLPGTDHAGIATQMVVERQLSAEGNVGRREMGRDDFIARVWRWKGESGGAITQQLRRLGASCDWSRERFTLDEGLSAAVRKIFVQLHRDGLIYRDKRLVNWDPHFQTAISDLEVEQREVDGAYWSLAYPLEDGSGEIVVATTRPETMLGDTAVAVHPDDERYTGLVGKRVRLPITGRLIPIVADAYADPEKGSGAVKITPAHDFNDFQVGKRHGLEQINVLDDFGRINAVGGDYAGLDRFVARKQIVARAEAEGWLRGIEKTRHVVPHGDRSGGVIEPYLTDQWYVDAHTLAQPAIAAVESGATVFEPANWSKTYFEWMRNIEPWCISRQLWWGHRIPAWYGPEGSIFVAETEEGAYAAARERFGSDVKLSQDEDVLDTWFSSGLWPFSTLGWPQDTPDLQRFYPTQTLVTGFDIIFFWVARMMMMGLYATKQVPFDRVVINGLVRDERGQKMSKSKGNVIDPLEIVDELGADALRFSMAILSGARDIKLSKSRIEGYRNFGTKLWNAARFCQMNGCALQPGFDPASVQAAVNRWIVGETAKAAAEVTAAFDAADFAGGAEALYRFVWNVVCDWYVELIKPVLNGEDEAARAETRATAAWVLDQAMTLLHPVSPFLTEELWRETAEAAGVARDRMLIASDWPDLPPSLVDAAAEAEIGLVIAVVTEGRSVRAELGVPPSAKPALVVTDVAPAARAALERNAAVIASTLRVAGLRFDDEPPTGSVRFVAEGVGLALPVAEIVDLAGERARLSKEVGRLDGEIERFEKKLGNADFVGRAPAAVIEENRAKLADAQGARAKLQAALERLSAV